MSVGGRQRESSVEFSSKRDAWLVCSLWLSIIGMGAGALVIWWAPASLIFRASMSGFLALGAAFIVWLMNSTTYRLTDRSLVVRAGPFRWTIDLHSIEAVFPTRNPLASPALSLDRLRIVHRASSFGIIVSPEDRAEFLRQIAAREPALKLSDGRLSRHPG